MTVISKDGKVIELINVITVEPECVVPNVWTLYTPARKLHSL